MIVCYVTCKNKTEAKKISKHLLNKKLVACSNMFPVSSMYWWNKKIVDVRIEELEIVELDKNGIIYAEQGLPEKRFLQAIENDALDLEGIRQKASLKKEELNVCIGLLRKKAAINIASGMVISIT